MMRTTDSRRSFHILVLLTFALMLVVVLLSAYMRLSAAGLGCTEWAGCYGLTLAGLSPHRPEWINTTHHLAASVMGLTVLGICTLAWHRRRSAPEDLPPAIALLVLTGFLAVLGRWTHNPHLPAVALGNLLGGMAMLALLWRLHLGSAPQSAFPSRLRGWIILGLALLVAQITLGGMVSAKFAATSCATLSGCEGWLQHAQLGNFNPFQELPAVQSGNFIPGEAQQTLHMAHRVLALLVSAYLVWLGTHLLRNNQRRSGKLLIAVLTLQVALGICSVAFKLPLMLVLMHNATAVFLLLTLVTFNCRLRDR